VTTSGRFAFAGAVAATVWALQQPFDRRLFRYDYSDVAVLGKAVTGSWAWPVVGTGLHALNGALFGLAFHRIQRRRSCGGPTRAAISLALAEHLALYPLSALVDRHHPRRGEPGIPRLMAPRAFAQATWRHLVFGAVLGRLVRLGRG
jgi:hypothetical protein